MYGSPHHVHKERNHVAPLIPKMAPPHVFASTLTQKRCEDLWDPKTHQFRVPLMFSAQFRDFLPQNCGFLKFEGFFLRDLFNFIAQHQPSPARFEFPEDAKNEYYMRVKFDKRTKPPPYPNMVGLLLAYPTLSRNRVVFNDAVFFHGRDCAQFLVTKSEPLTAQQASAMVSRMGIDLSREGFMKMLKKNTQNAHKIQSTPPLFSEATSPSS